MVGCLLCGNSFNSTAGSSSVDGLCNKDSCTVCREMLELEERIIETRRQLASLVAAQLDMKMRQNQAHDPFVLRFPPEISSRIFRFCINFRTVDEFYSGTAWYRDRNETRPFDLASTCKGWRAIALSTPQLWTEVKISLAQPANTRQAYLEYQTRLLSRSGSLPFSLFITDDKISIKSTKPLSGLISLLNQHSTRWQIIHICAPSSIVTQLKGCGKPSAALMAVIIDKLESFRSGHKFRLTGGNPAPQYVRANYMPFRSLHINWSKATHAQLNNVSITEFHNLLLEATQLGYLSLSYFDTEEAQNSLKGRVHTIICPSLTELRICEMKSTEDPSLLEDIFGPLLLSNLEHLEFYCFQIVGLSSALGRHFSSLRSLKLTDIPGDPEDIVDELGKFPSIETLTFEVLSYHALLERLAATRDVDCSNAADEPFLPKLRELLIDGYFDEMRAVHWSLVASIFPSTFAENRRPLRRLGIPAETPSEKDVADEHTASFIPEPYLEVFQRLIDHGCSLNIASSLSNDFIQESREFHALRLSSTT